MRRFLIAAVLLVTAVPTCSAAVEIRETRPASPKGEVAVEIPFGSVQIIGWDRSEVLVEGTVGPGVESVDVSSDSGDVSVEVELGGGYGKAGMIADLVIHVPAASEVSLEGIHTTMEVRNIRGGAVDAESVSGDVAVAGELKSVVVESISGNVEISGTVGSVSIETASGNITADAVDGEFDIETVSGDVVVRGGTIKRGQVSTASGSVRIEGRLAATGDLDVETLSGEVWLVVPEDVSAEFEIETFSGQIRSDFTGGDSTTSSRHASKYLSFITGVGGFQVNIDTFSGRCEIRRR